MLFYAQIGKVTWPTRTKATRFYKSEYKDEYSTTLDVLKTDLSDNIIRGEFKWEHMVLLLILLLLLL